MKILILIIGAVLIAWSVAERLNIASCEGGLNECTFRFFAPLIVGIILVIIYFFIKKK